MADMDGSIIISEQLQERLLQFQADCRIYNDMLLQWYKDVRAAIRQEGYSKAEIDMILEWYIDPDVLQLVQAAKDGKRNLKERIQKKKTALQARWGVQAVIEVEQKFGEIMSTSEAFMQALVDISAECPVATAIAGIEEQSNKRRATKHGGISGKAMWTRRDVLLAREGYRASQECLRSNSGTQEAGGREDVDLENEAIKMNEHGQVGIALEQDVDMAAGPDGDRDMFSEIESNRDVQHAQGSVVGDWDDDMAQEFDVAKTRGNKRGKKRKLRRHQTGASKRARDSSPEVEYPRDRAEALSDQVCILLDSIVLGRYLTLARWIFLMTLALTITLIPHNQNQCQSNFPAWTPTWTWKHLNRRKRMSLNPARPECNCLQPCSMKFPTFLLRINNKSLLKSSLIEKMLVKNSARLDPPLVITSPINPLVPLILG
jgi:hypothetical protein